MLCTKQQFDKIKQYELSKWQDGLTCNKNDFTEWIQSTRNHSYMCGAYNRMCCFCPFRGKYKLLQAEYGCGFNIDKLKQEELTLEQFISICNNNIKILEPVTYDSVVDYKRSATSWVERIFIDMFKGKAKLINREGDYERKRLL